MTMTRIFFRTASVTLLGLVACTFSGERMRGDEAAPAAKQQEKVGAIAADGAGIYFSPEARAKKLSRPWSKMAAHMEWKGLAVSEPDRSVWCCCPIEGPDKKIHMFVARGQPGAEVGPTWGKTCVIAHYLADRPEGPFMYESTVFEGTKDGSWDSYGPMNPDVRRIDGKYVMAYTGTRDLATFPGSMSVGMALADDLNGPWRRVGQLVDPAKVADLDATHGGWIDNPTLLKHKGKYYCYFKRCSAGKQLEAKYCVAMSDKLVGPYEYQGVATDNTSYIEDAFVWEQGGVIYLMTTDNFSQNVPGSPRANILWQSTDPLHFRLSEATLATGTIKEHWRDWDPKRSSFPYSGSGVPFFADPCFLLQDGKPTYFYGPSDCNVTGGKFNEIYCMELHWNDPSQVDDGSDGQTGDGNGNGEKGWE